MLSRSCRIGAWFQTQDISMVACEVNQEQKDPNVNDTRLEFLERANTKQVYEWN